MLSPVNHSISFSSSFLLSRRLSPQAGSGPGVGAAGMTVFDPFVTFCRSITKLAQRPISVVDDHIHLAIETLISWCGRGRSAFVVEQAIGTLWKLTMQATTASTIASLGKQCKSFLNTRPSSLNRATDRQFLLYMCAHMCACIGD